MGEINEVTAINRIRGYRKTEILKITDYAGTNISATMTESTYLSVDASGVAKVDLVQNDGVTTIAETKQLTAGLLYPMLDVKSLYQSYTLSTTCTAQVYDEYGNLVPGIKIHL